VRYFSNPFRERRREFHRSLDGYENTPLADCRSLAESLGLGRVFIKDESKRFGLNAFKVLGASWAMHQAAQRRAGPITFACATDGNHGRAVAWMARRLGSPAVVFIPSNMVPARAEALRNEGATVVVTDGSYDEAVRRCAEESQANGWQVISDTGYAGNVEIPQWVVEGYATLFEECDEQLASASLPRPEVVMVQAGVGGLLSAAVRHFRGRGDDAIIISVEPDDADCLMESITSPAGHPRPALGSQNSIMSGLNCGEASLTAWPLVRAGVDLFLTIPDRYAEEAMRWLAHPTPPDPAIVAGESGAAGFGGLLALCREKAFKAARDQAGLSSETVVLLLNTEGDTDPDGYRRVVG